MTPSNRIAISGIGIISCLGLDLETVGAALRSGRSGIAVDPQREKHGFCSPLAGRIDGFKPKSYLSRKERKTMPLYCIQAYAAAKDALDLAGLTAADLANDRTGLIFGNDSSCLAAVEQVDKVREHGTTGAIGSGLVFRSMTSNVTMNLNTLFGTRGASWSLSSACSSGGHAIGQAASLIALGLQDRMICGGAQELNWECMCSFDALEAFSTRVEDPAAASRPFDADRDGLIPSGGAAALVLERMDLAQKRGAAILGEICGYGFSSDGYRLSVPSPDGLQRAMQGALKSAEWQARDIDYLCAHATSTPAGDAAEARNITAVFGPQGPPVASLKAMTGHELWMSGASQVVYCTIMAMQGFTAASVNFEKPDADTADLNILRATRSEPPQKVLCNAAGFGGTNSCLAVDFCL